MQFTESWLKCFVDTTLSSAELAEKLTMAGLEVEALEPVAPFFQGVVVGQILSRQNHPNADRLSVCQVDTGEGTSRQIVCGASNALVGLKVPCALSGAILPGGLDIKSSEVRGIRSDGMLCSAKEIGLSSSANGLHVFDDDTPLGCNVRDWLKLDEMLFTLKMTPNRADCLSILGIAREVSALTGYPLKKPTVEKVPVQIADVLKVKVCDQNLCGRFAGRIIRNVNNKVKTPLWMVQRLERSGQRSLNPLVDISNYVMLEWGRPSHVFDLNQLKGDLTVRWAQEGEKIRLVNEHDVELNSNLGVICDASGPQALAGIMGGQHSAVTSDTVDIYIEAAFWHPNAIVGRTRALNFSSEAAHRFERGVDFETIPEHLEYITQLIENICGGKPGPIKDQCLNLPVRHPVKLRHTRLEFVIGMNFSVEQIADVFNKLQFKSSTEDNENDTHYCVIPPSYRFDIQIEEDLIEEVIRVIGYDKLPTRAPLGKVQMLANSETSASRNALRHRLAGLGYQEVVTYSFVKSKWESDFNGNDKPIQLLNPIASHLNAMRSSLLGSLVDVLKLNLAHRADRLRIFELARTFSSNASVTDSISDVQGFSQNWKFAGLAFGLADQLQWGASNNRNVDFFDVKGDLEQLLYGHEVDYRPFSHIALHPGRCAQLFLDDNAIGFVGELHPSLQQQYELPCAPIVFEVDVMAVQKRELATHSEISKRPSVIRDLAFIVSEHVHASELRKALMDVQGSHLSWLKSVILFDEFVQEEEGKGLKKNEKSLAFRLTLQASDKNLTETDIEPLLNDMVANALHQCAARLR